MVKIKFGLLILLLILGIVFGLRFFGSPEDSWVCENGVWVKHGNPLDPQPTGACTTKSIFQFFARPTPTSAFIVYTEDQSRQIAQDFIQISPTYGYDGRDLTYQTSRQLDCPYCWEFTFSFQSRQAGYGNRSGQMLAQVVTPHQIVVTVRNGQIASAVTDGKFDELNSGVK